MATDGTGHPYVPGSEPGVQDEMLKAIGVESVEALFATIPEHLRYRGPLDVPGPLDEFTLRRTFSTLLNRNQSTADFLSFLGGGCWPHFVPAVCDEVAQRAEFLTAYAGEPYEDHGRFQALFEYQSLVGELLEMDVVNVPTFDWAQAAATALRMACRVTGRRRVLIPEWIHPDRARVIRNYANPDVEVVAVRVDRASGRLDRDDLAARLTPATAAVYLEVPSFFGVIEDDVRPVAELAHQHGALLVAGVDPISLGVLAPPVRYGADIVCGELQPLGIHMYAGGGLAGFIATPDEERFVMEYPSRLFGITPTAGAGEYGFGDVAYERTSFAQREKGREAVGTQTALWGIVAGVYLALVGAAGLRQVGEATVQKGAYLRQLLGRIPGVRVPRFAGAHFKEFVVDFTATGRSVRQINRYLYERGVFGGRDLSADFPDLGQAALYCVTEIHAQQDLERLADLVAAAAKE